MRLIDADITDKKIESIYNAMNEAIVEGNADKMTLKIHKVCEVVRVILNRQPTIEAEPIRHSTWKHIAGMNSKCSECGHYFPVKEFETRPFDINFCPNCGAKMDGGDSP